MNELGALGTIDISASSIMAGIIFGAIGLWIFRVGKKDADMKKVLIGMALMIYPYFVSGYKLEWGIGIALCALAKYLWYS